MFKDIFILKEIEKTFLKFQMPSFMTRTTLIS